MKINDTASYHREEMKSLGWELTVCNMLEDALSPARSVLRRPGTFGELLFSFLAARVPCESLQSICEIGGGYGYLMRDFLSLKNFNRAAMIDISPFLLGEQRKTLKNAPLPVTFIESDFLLMEKNFLQNVDIAVLNENIGDFPTLCDVSAQEIMGGSEGAPGLMREAARIAREYHLSLHEGSFHLNIGALLACEKLCTASVPVIYMSEHSCEAAVPEELIPMVTILSSGRPERIALKGHDEYTIQFSYLEQIAQSLGYQVMRGTYGDILEVDFSGSVNFIMRSASVKEDHEVIRHFIEDVYKYEYLVLVKA